MLVYVDSSVLVRAYLPDESGHQEALALLNNPHHLLVTSTWTVVELTSALARASRGSRVGHLDDVISRARLDTSTDGPITLLRADSDQVEHIATRIVSEHALRSLDAIHLAVAELSARPLAEPGEQIGFASRDTAQRAVAEALGYIAM